MTAAAYAKEFLQYISPAQTKLAKPIQDVMGKSILIRLSLGTHD
jgi:hypothetical protein